MRPGNRPAVHLAGNRKKCRWMPILIRGRQGLRLLQGHLFIAAFRVAVTGFGAQDLRIAFLTMISFS